jgi:glycine/D-amino acid oxidase-like deaminating enzyme
MSDGTFGNPQIVEHKTDILIIGGGMAACGAAYEAKRWAGDDVKITLVDKAAMDRSGAVAQGLSAINTYLGENSAEDYVRMVSADLMGITRDDLVENERDGRRAAQGRRKTSPLWPVADHDQRRELQAHRRRSRKEGARH